VSWLKIALGTATVLFAVLEMFDDLFHPTRSGAFSEWVGSGLFRLFRRWPSMLPTAGPLTVVVAIFSWAMLLAVGFALIYWAVFPADFTLPPSAAPAGADRFWWSLYYSLEMLTTLGLGDIRPNPTWLKVLSGFHTLIGFSLITSSITWILLVFPALRRTRTLARRAMTLTDAAERTSVPVVSTGMHVILAGLAEEVIQLRVDLIHFPVLFYFYAQDSRASLPCALFPLMRFAAEGMEPARDDLVRLTATSLQIALKDFADLVGERLDCEDRTPTAVFQKFAELHTV
jgi:hypothetical protein